MNATETPESDAACIETDHGNCVRLDKARSLERRALLAEEKLKHCAGLAEHWRMQAPVISRRSGLSVNGALVKCAFELEKALDQIGKEANE